MFHRGKRLSRGMFFFLADLSVFIYLNPAMFVSSEDHNETITEKGKWEQIWNGYNEWTESWIDEIEFTTTLTKETRNLGYWEPNSRDC